MVKKRSSFHFSVDDSLLFHLRVRAVLEDRSQSEVVEDALRLYFQQFDDSKLMTYYHDHAGKEGQA